MSEQRYTSAEMMTIAAARRLANRRVCFVGIGIPSAAANQQRPMSTLALTRAALENSPEFDKEMDSRARHDLPGFNRKESMLSVLAKE